MVNSLKVGWEAKDLKFYISLGSLQDHDEEIKSKTFKNQSVVVEEKVDGANAAKAIAKEYMRDGQSFVWNATNLSYQLRSTLIRLFVSYQASIRIVLPP